MNFSFSAMFNTIPIHLVNHDLQTLMTNQSLQIIKFHCDRLFL
jgi:hypothetical protein